MSSSASLGTKREWAEMVFELLGEEGVLAAGS